MRALVLLAVVLAGCGPDGHSAMKEPNRTAVLRNETLPPPYDRLRSLARPLGPAALGSWLSVHSEPGQSLREYEQQAPPPGMDGAIVLTRLGNVTPRQARALALAAPYLEAFYDRPVRRIEDLDLARVPASDQRGSHGYGLQVRTGFVLDSLLAPACPPDAFVLIALATVDLYPDSSWNFVFGQARPNARVGVWSLVRFDDGAEERQFARRTLCTAAHEIGHLAGLSHCITWSCLMNGSNSLPEADARRLELCPSCMAKLCRRFDIDPVRRATRLSAVLGDAGLAEDAAFEQRVKAALLAKDD
jgi:archaemetzincin